MHLSLGQTCSIRQSLDLCGGLTQTIFPKVEEWLNETTDHQAALEWAAARKNMDRYHSVVDFLFCETFTHFRPLCVEFYEADGQPLREIISADQTRRFQQVLMSVLTVAYEAFETERRVSWGWVRDEGIARAA